MRSLLDNAQVFAAAYSHEGYPMAVFERCKALTCTYPGGRPPTCGFGATAGLSV